METRNFQDITRDSEFVKTTMRLSHGPEAPKIIVCGASQLHNYGADHSAQFRAFLRDGATDGEHDSAKAFSIPLIGLEPQIAGTLNSLYEGWVEPEYRSFWVGGPDYDPFEGAEDCEDDICPDDHVITDYLPEQTEKTRELFDTISGEKVEIQWSVTREEQ